MASVSEVIQEAIIRPLMVAFEEQIAVGMKDESLKIRRSGNLYRSIRVTNSPGGTIHAASYLRDLEKGVDDAEAMNSTYTQTVTRKTSKGTVSYKRTYKGMKPKKLWKKSAGGTGNDTAWRVVQLYGKPPLGLVDRAVQAAIEYVTNIQKAQSILPATVEVTSLD